MFTSFPGMAFCATNAELQGFGCIEGLFKLIHIIPVSVKPVNKYGDNIGLAYTAPLSYGLQLLDD